MNYADAYTIIRAGFDAWAAKPHNAKWARRIDGTPIPNDLPVCIATAFQEADAPYDWKGITAAQIEELADRLTGHGISGLQSRDWPILVLAMELASANAPETATPARPDREVGLELYSEDLW